MANIDTNTSAAHHDTNASKKHSKSSPNAKKKSKDVEVHVCRFLNYEPSAIVAVHLHDDNTHCAIGRENGNIEIWDLNGSFIQRIIPGRGASTIQSLLWINTNYTHQPNAAKSNHSNASNKKLRLISSGLDGWLHEWNLETLSAHSKMSCHGYAIWSIAQCLVVESNATGGAKQQCKILISAACDDGKLRVYRLAEDEFIFQCEFTTSKRCLSTTWSHAVYRDSASMVVYGGTANGLIFGYDIITRQQMVNIVVTPPAVGGVRKHQTAVYKPLIWSLCSLHGSSKSETGNGRKLPQIACSTSRGNVDVYEAEFGTLIQSYNAAKNDIFSLDYVHFNDRNGDLIELLVAGCVDGRVLQLTRRNHEYQAVANINDVMIETVSKQTEFVQTGYHRYHTHDVNAVSVTKDKVVSGGVDTQLISCSTRDFWTHYICSPLADNTTSSNLVKVADKASWIKEVLPVDADGDSEIGGGKLKEKLFLFQKERNLELWYLFQQNPIKVMDIKVGFDVYNILCSAISRDGKYIAVANNQCIKLWRVTVAQNKSLKLAKVFQSQQRGCSTLNFSNDGKYLFITPSVVSTSSNVKKIKLKEEEDSDSDDEKDIGVYLDKNRDKNSNIIRIDLEKQAIDKVIKIGKHGANHMISSLRLNSDSSLCSVIVPSLLYAAVIHIEAGKVFYEIPRGVNGVNISCIEFQRVTDQKNKKKNEEVLYVIYADNTIRLFQYDYECGRKNNENVLLFKCKNSLRLHSWYANNNKIWNAYNQNNPFAFTKVLFNPLAETKALLLRPEYMFSLVVNKKLPTSHLGGIGAKRTFAVMESSGNNSIDQLIPSPFGKPQGGKNKDSEKSGQQQKKSSFLRVVRKYDPIIHAEFIEGNTLLIVHAPWHKVSSAFKRPVFRKKYAI